MANCSRVIDFSYAFKFEKASKLSVKKSSYESPCFKVDILEDTDWIVMCRSFIQNRNFLSIFIKNISTNFLPTQFELTLSVLSTDPSLNVSKKAKVSAVRKALLHGFDKFLRWDEVLTKRNVYLPRDTLTIQCYIVRQRGIEDFSVDEKGPSLSQSESYITGLNNDLYNLYLDGKFCDIKIETPDRTFHVHKTVLCARSEVFFAMFENDTKEKASGIVKLKELDSGTVNRMLTFMYSDSLVESLNNDQATNLYKTADMYNIPVLKQKCSYELKKFLSYENVLEICILADLLRDADLKLAAENCIFIYSNKIFKSMKWKDFMQSSYKLSGEIMHNLWLKNLDSQV